MLPSVRRLEDAGAGSLASTQRKNTLDEPISQFAARLTELFEFIGTQARAIDAGVLQDGAKLQRRIRDFYTAGRLEAIENMAPGWQKMAAYSDGATLIHVSQAIIALQLLPEYRQAEAPLRAMMEWSVFFHDIGKQVVAGTRDAVHAFRSAALTARALPLLGFGCMNCHALVVEPWVDLVLGASVAALDGKGLVQDYRPLPQILEGSGRLFGERSAASLIVQAVLLHQSLNVVPEWPNAASLTDVQVGACISPALVPLLEGLMLADSDAWQFEPHHRPSSPLDGADTRRQFRHAAGAALRLVSGHFRPDIEALRDTSGRLALAPF